MSIEALSAPGVESPASHDEAMAAILGAGSVTVLSYEEAIAIYLRMRWILRDGAEMMGAPIPTDWSERQAATRN